MKNEGIVTKEGGTTATEPTRSGQFYRPNVDILEKADELLVLADLPGASKDQIDINFDKGELSLHAAVPLRQGRDQQYLAHEYGVGDYYRTFRIGETIDPQRISADYADGVLSLHLPKAESAKPRKIAVTAK
jgi:HSP20 family protein